MDFIDESDPFYMYFWILLPCRLAFLRCVREKWDVRVGGAAGLPLCGLTVHMVNRGSRGPTVLKQLGEKGGKETRRGRNLIHRRTLACFMCRRRYFHPEFRGHWITHQKEGKQKI